MKFKLISINKIKPNPHQPRENFNEEKLSELADSIKEMEILQPIIVRPNNGIYEIVSGERRWRASQYAGIKKIPAIIKKLNNKQLMMESLVENLQRVDLTDFEKAKAIRTIMKNNGFKSKSELAKSLGLSPTAVYQYLSILPLEKEIKNITGPNEVGVSVLSSIARIPQKTIRQKIVKKFLNGDINSIEVQKMVPIIRDKKISKQIRQAVIEQDLDSEVARELSKIDDKRIHKRVIQKLAYSKKLRQKIINAAKEAEERASKMQPKMFRLKELLNEGLNLSTVWDIGFRENYAGDPNFHGNSPPQVVEHCVLRLTKENDLVVDPMSGSGTTIDVCREFNRKCIAYDINSIRGDIIKNDSRKIPLDDESVDLVFMHPPYWNIVKYSSDKNDLSKAKTLNDFLKGLEKVIRESHRILKNKKFLCILIGDMVENGEFISLSRKIANLAEEIGFKDFGYAVKMTKNSTSQVVKGKMLYAELAYTGNLKINHDIVMFWQKAK